MLALKFKDYTLKNNWDKYLVIMLSIISIGVLDVKSLPVIISLYFFISVISDKISLK
jgi:CDP-diacylglycerol--serine O-phosphatidyltransferase